ncbi:M15 family metallopeptidase [Humibacter antri]
MPPLILMNDPRVKDFGVVDLGEPLVDLEGVGVVSFSDRKRATNPRLSCVRQGVADRIEQASRELPTGIRFLGVEGFRPPALQLHYYRHYREHLRSENPDVSDETLSTLTARFVSPPEVAPHPSGAAIDLTLSDENGRELDLGSAVDATPEVSAGACFTAAAGLTSEATANRQLLVEVLTSAGLVNYPTEWWHWSYGDRYWAMTTRSRRALYGPVTG